MLESSSFYPPPFQLIPRIIMALMALMPVYGGCWHNARSILCGMVFTNGLSEREGE